MVKLRLLPLLALLSMMASCAQQELRPVEPALQSDLRGADGQASTAGVTMTASTGAWEAIPTNLDGLLTPILVRIENQSDRDLRVDYSNFQVVGASGRSYAALPPFSIDETDVATLAQRYPYYPHTGFGVAPHLARYYSGVLPYGNAYDFNRPYYDRYYPHWRSGGYVDLPTDDMLSRAMPEGVVSPGGALSGFVYFENLKEMEPVDVRVSLVDAKTGENFGVISIPFVPEEPGEA